MLPNVVCDLSREVSSLVEHRQDDPLDLERRVEAPAHALDGLQELGDAFQGKVLGLYRHEHGVGRGQSIDGQERKRGRGVDEEELEVFAQRLDRLLQPRLAARLVDELDLRADQVPPGGKQRKVWKGRLPHRAVGAPCEENVVGARALVFAGKAESRRRVGLRVQIDQQDAPIQRSQRSGEVDRGRGLSHAPFLVGDGDNAAHEDSMIDDGSVPIGRRQILNGAVFQSSSFLPQSSCSVPRGTFLRNAAITLCRLSGTAR